MSKRFLKERLPRYKKAKTPPPMVLTERDKRIVGWVYQMRFLTSNQIKLLEFEDGSMTACRRRLALLYHNGYLSAIQKFVPAGYGSSKRVYCLSKKGWDLIDHLYNGAVGGKIKWDEKRNKVQPYFVDHVLAINDVRIAFIKAAKGYELVWVPEWEIKSWKEKVEDPENPGKTLPITPDAFLSLIGKDKKACYFLEIDRATESNQRWRNKVKGYVEYVKSGQYYERFKTTALRVLTVSTTPERINNLTRTTQTVDDAYFFLFTTLSSLKDKNIIADPIWKAPGKENLVSLL